ncbi:helix-turn-helix domain-containing protein [Actinoplanes sp. CA-142083]|uniref:helix-turn-helix domain-containing protein n=1 Tax=Actinoplanes sp. CA-142083 TaxID=3239903 RepID=UPI003D8A9394
MQQRLIGELLTELKDRHGYSYAQIARKANLSKSAVHRYCAGQSVPQTFAPIESIARACGADRPTIDKLYAAWSGGPGKPEPETPGQETPGQETEAPAKRTHNRALLLAAAALVAAVAAVVIVVLRPDGRPVPSVAGTAQQVTGPAWTLTPAPVPRTLFGATLNSSSGDMPGFDLGAVRLWDSETRWSQVEPRRRAYDWRTLDGLVAGARKAGLPALYVFGGTPSWAAPGGALSVYPEGARSSPPDDLADWDAYVRAVAGRYRGRIEAYELWVLANDKRMYTGSPETMVAMTRRASDIIRAADPMATVVCPGMGNLWTEEGQRVLTRFAQLGGYRYCDVAGIKLFQQAASDPPETMLDLLGRVDQLLHDAEVHPRLWNTGTTYTIALQKPLDATTARNYAVRFFLVGLYARNYNLERMYFYNWGGTKIPIVLQADGGEPTAAARAVDTLQHWLAAAQSRSCGHGSAAGLPENAWQCELIVGTRRAAVRWTQSGTATMPVDAPIAAVHHLDGRVDRPSPGAELPLAEDPIFVEYA